MRRDNVFPRFDFRNYLTARFAALRLQRRTGKTVRSVLASADADADLSSNHTFRYGYDFRSLHERFTTDGYSAGRFLFDGTYTMQASNSGATQRDRAGRDLAAFLLGVPVTGGASIIDNPTDIRYDCGLSRDVHPGRYTPEFAS